MHRGLVGGQVDHAVGDHHIHRGVGQRDVLDLPLHELHVRRAGLGRVRPRQGEHLVGHVQAVGEPGRPDPPRGQQHVDPAAGPQVQHPFPVPELGHRERVPAAQRGQHRLLGQPVGLARGVEGGAEDVALVGVTDRAAAHPTDRNNWSAARPTARSNSPPTPTPPTTPPRHTGPGRARGCPGPNWSSPTPSHRRTSMSVHREPRHRRLSIRRAYWVHDPFRDPAARRCRLLRPVGAAAADRCGRQRISPGR